VSATRTKAVRGPLVELLAEANRQLTGFRSQVTEQAAWVRLLDRVGEDTDDARATLAIFQETLRFAEKHREILVAELADETLKPR